MNAGPPFLNSRQQWTGRQQRQRYLAMLFTGLAIVGLLSAFLLIALGNTQQKPPLAHGSTPTSTSTARPVTPTAVPPTLTPTAVPQTAQLSSQIDDLFKTQLADHQFTGSLLVAEGGQVVMEQGYGLANEDNNTPNDPDTRFYLGSVTKEFTAMATLILQQQGKLNVQDTVCSHITNCPSPWAPVTIKELLTHTSGIPELSDSQLSGASPAAWIASFNSAPLAFVPGNQFDYCSECYQILAYVVQQVSGQPYTQFVQQMILGPLKMQHTGFDPDYYYAQSDHAQGYASWQVKAVQLGWSLGLQWAFLDGSGLLYSTVNDLFRWDQGLYTNTLLPQQALQTAFTAYSSVSLFAGSGYGYGWFIAKSPVAGHRLIWHDGVIDGFRTYIGRYIDDHVTIIFLSNLATLNSLSLAHSVEQIVFRSHVL